MNKDKDKRDCEMDLLVWRIARHTLQALEGQGVAPDALQPLEAALAELERRLGIKRTPSERVDK